MSDREWRALCRALETPQWLDDARFATPALRDRNIDARLEIIQERLLTRPANEWLARLEAEGVPCAPVLTRNEMIHHPQVAANELVQIYPHPQAGPLRQARPPARFSVTESSIRRGAPMLGEDTEAILAELGVETMRRKELARDGVIRGI